MAERTQRSNILLAFISLTAVIAVVSLIGFFTLGKGPEIIQGQAEADEYRVSGKVPARILELRVKEGNKVKAGDTLVILEAPDVMAKLSQAQAAEQAARAISEKAQRGTRREQLQAAFEMWQKAKAGVEIAEKSYNRVNRLFEQGVMSAQKRDEAKAQFDAMAATEKAARSQYEMAKNGARQEDKAAAAAQVERAKGAVAEVSSYMDETILTAAADGEVTEIFPKVGELVGTGAPIMNIARLDDMWVTFNVREDFLKDFTVGEEINAFIPAFDKEVKFKVTYMKDLGTYAAIPVLHGHSSFVLLHLLHNADVERTSHGYAGRGCRLGQYSNHPQHYPQPGCLSANQNCGTLCRLCRCAQSHAGRKDLCFLLYSRRYNGKGTCQSSAQGFFLYQLFLSGSRVTAL